MIKSDRNYLIGVEVIIDTNYLLILGMMQTCTIPDVAILRWISYVKITQSGGMTYFEER